MKRLFCNIQGSGFDGSNYAQWESYNCLVGLDDFPFKRWWKTENTPVASMEVTIEFNLIWMNLFTSTNKQFLQNGYTNASQHLISKAWYVTTDSHLFPYLQ